LGASVTCRRVVARLFHRGAVKSQWQLDGERRLRYPGQEPKNIFFD
jgi:hypothetical protein